MVSAIRIYLQASDNLYLGADDHGSWDTNFLGLVLSATVNERSEVWAQLEGTTDEGTRFTWFFVDYQVSENLRAHVGRVKMPLGFYNETIDAKFLQVAQLEPSLYQSAADIVHDAYHGAGIDYEWAVGNGHLFWQVYGGNVYDVDPPQDTKDRRVIGGRATYRTPVAGLRFMVSAYRTQVETLADGSFSNEDRVIGWSSISAIAATSKRSTPPTISSASRRTPTTCRPATRSMTSGRRTCATTRPSWTTA